MMRTTTIQSPAQASNTLSLVDHDLTLLIPAYNEAERLPRSLRDAKAFLDEWGVDYRVIVIDNGSKDGTGDIASQFGPRFSTMCQAVPGKGAAVRMGMLAARGQVVAFTDADLPFDLASLRIAYDKISTRKCSVVLGCRDMAGSTDVVSRSVMRTLASFVFRKCVSRLVSGEVTDTQCGLKVFSHRAAHQIFSRTTINGFAFDTEVIFITHLLSLPFSQVPVTLVNDYGTTISLVRNALPMLGEVLRVRWQALQGGYDRSNALSREPELERPRTMHSKAA